MLRETCYKSPGDIQHSTFTPRCVLLPFGNEEPPLRAHVPFGGRGCSRGDVGHHGVVHVGQRPRRTRREIVIPVSDLKPKSRRRKRADSGEKDVAVPGTTSGRRAQRPLCRHLESEGCSAPAARHNSCVTLKPRQTQHLPRHKGPLASSSSSTNVGTIPIRAII